MLSLSPIDSRLLILRLRSFKNGYDYGPKISRGIINHSSFPNYLENKNSHIGHENAYRKMSNDLEKVASGRRIRSNNHLLNYKRINYRYHLKCNNLPAAILGVKGTFDALKIISEKGIT